jgi:hypothetical protein
MSVTKANTSPASATRRKALLFSDSKASFLSQNLMGFRSKDLYQFDSIKSCLAIFANFLGRHVVGKKKRRSAKIEILGTWLFDAFKY